MNLQWLIIGGGIHGVHIAVRLLAEAGIRPEGLRIVDPGKQLLSRWRTCTSTTGMNYLRSPSVHHLDLSPWSLQRFAGSRKNRKPGLFTRPYDRPSLNLFNAHCEQVIESFGLAALHIQDRAVKCNTHCDSVSVELASGDELRADNIVLAIGAGEAPQWPHWAPQHHARVHHIFDPSFEHWPTNPQSVAVVGGGISAGQVALRLVEEGHSVELVCRHALRQHQFDSDPGWLGPKYMAGFSRESDLEKRRDRISEARHRGSMPPDVYRTLRRAIERGKLRWHEAEVESFDSQADKLEISLSSRESLQVEQVLLAPGFAGQRPGGEMVDELITSAGLPCAACGYPVVDSGLRWHPRIYVAGPLAELELGPVSRNIAGARKAGERLVKALGGTAAQSKPSLSPV